MLKRFIWIGLLIVVGIGLWQWFKPAPQPVQSGNVRATKLYFCRKVGNAGQVVAVNRQTPSTAKLMTAVNALLQGPTPQEQQQGYYTEIPPSVRLLSINKTANGQVVNVSNAFTTGGGTESMTLRLKQVTQTILAAEPNQPVYLWVNGTPLTVLGGEGIEVPQPLTNPSDPS
jgi:spore germination protein GerM